MLPAAPGLFSTTTLWSHILPNSLLTSRAIISVVPPAVKATTVFTGLVGQSCARAVDAPACMAISVAKTAACPIFELHQYMFCLLVFIEVITSVNCSFSLLFSRTQPQICARAHGSPQWRPYCLHWYYHNSFCRPATVPHRLARLTAIAGHCQT